MSQQDTARPAGAQSVGRALALLRIIASSEVPLSLADLVSMTGMNRTTVWRLLNELIANDFVIRADNGEYGPGLACIALGVSARNRYDALVRTATPVMEGLRETTGETVILAVPYDVGVLNIAQLDSPAAVRLRNYLYEVSPMRNSSTGKALLATHSPTEIERYLASDKSAGGTTTTREDEALVAELAIIRERGWAQVVEELAPGENGISAAVRVAGRAVAILNVSGPSFRFDEARLQECAGALLDACASLESALSINR